MSELLDYPRTTFQFIGRIENFDEDFRALQTRLNIDLTKYYRSHRRHGTQAQEVLDEFYTPALKRKVADHYAEDFELGGYSP